MTAPRFTWRHHPRPPVYDAGIVAELVTCHGEVVGDIARHRKGPRFTWTLYGPRHWVVADDPPALDTREQAGTGAIVTWGSGHATKRAAARGLLDELDRRSIGLLGLDDLDLPTWNGPCIGELAAPKPEL